jgi:2'-5' RNA ligase
MKVNGYEFGSSQVSIPENLRQIIIRDGLEIIPQQIVERRETNPHLTIKYGLIDVDPELFRKAVQNVAQFRVKFGTIQMFKKEDGGFNVLYLSAKDSIGSNGLVQLRRIAEKFAADGAPAHSSYVPHITLAYVTGGENLIGEETSLTGKYMTVKDICYCTRDGMEHQCFLRAVEKKNLADIYNFNVQNVMDL